MVKELEGCFMEIAGIIPGGRGMARKVLERMSPKPELIDQKALIERWRGLHAIKEDYPASVNPDGSVYSAGTTLSFVNSSGAPEQVMDTFETPWCERTVEEMFRGRRGPQNVIERGYGLGIMSKKIFERVKRLGGTYISIELNDEVFEDSVNHYMEEFAKAQSEDREMILTISRIGQEPITLATKVDPSQDSQKKLPPVETHLIHGDADEVLANLPKEYDGFFDLIFSDTHQLYPGDIGIHDLHDIPGVVRRLKDNGRFTFLLFHRYNLTGELDDAQKRKIYPYLDCAIFPERIVAHDHSQYLPLGEIFLPVTVCQIARFYRTLR